MDHSPAGMAVAAVSATMDDIAYSLALAIIEDATNVPWK
jgi:hypothetical protein